MSSLIGKLFHFKPKFIEEFKFKKQKKKDHCKKKDEGKFSKQFKEDTEK